MNRHWCFDRDAYGFAVRPQHVQRYREYANIYKVLFYLNFHFPVDVSGLYEKCVKNECRTESLLL